MKKKSVKKKTNIPKKEESCKPFFDDKKLLITAVIAFFIFAFLLNFIDVTGVNAGITGQPIREGAGFVEKLLADWSAGNLDVNIAKYFFWGILAIFIFSILNAVSIPDNRALQWLIAIPVSFLGVAYLAPKEIFSLITAYSALGSALLFGLTFAIMLFASAMLITPKPKKGKNRMSAGAILFEAFLWLIYTAFLVYFTISAWGNISRAMNFIMAGAALLSLCLFIFNKGFRKSVRRLALEIKKAGAREDLTDAQISKARVELEKQDTELSKDLEEKI